MENTKVKNQNLNYVLPAYLVKTSKKALFGFKIIMAKLRGKQKWLHPRSLPVELWAIERILDSKSQKLKGQKCDHKKAMKKNAL